MSSVQMLVKQISPLCKEQGWALGHSEIPPLPFPEIVVCPLNCKSSCWPQPSFSHLVIQPFFWSWTSLSPKTIPSSLPRTHPRDCLSLVLPLPIVIKISNLQALLDHPQPSHFSFGSIPWRLPESEPPPCLIICPLPPAFSFLLI